MNVNILKYSEQNANLPREIRIFKNNTELTENLNTMKQQIVNNGILRIKKRMDRSSDHISVTLGIPWDQYQSILYLKTTF